MQDHIEQTIAAASEAAVNDAISLVKSHPNYQHIVETLAGKALDVLSAGL
jgi:hypothetical protein